MYVRNGKIYTLQVVIAVTSDMVRGSKVPLFGTMHRSIEFDALITAVLLDFIFSVIFDFS